MVSVLVNNDVFGPVCSQQGCVGVDQWLGDRVWYKVVVILRYKEIEHSSCLSYDEVCFFQATYQADNQLSFLFFIPVLPWGSEPCQELVIHDDAKLHRSSLNRPVAVWV